MGKEKKELTDEQCKRLLAIINARTKNEKIVSSLERDEIIVSVDADKRVRIGNTTVDLTVFSFCGVYADGLVATEAGAGGFGNEERVFIKFNNETPKNSMFEGGCMIYNGEKAPYILFRGPKTLELAVSMFKGIVAVLEREIENRKEDFDEEEN